MKRNRMLAEQRRKQLLQRVKEDGIAKTADLAKDYRVSPMTIRNDLSALASQGHLERIHGGAIAQRWLSKEPSYLEKARLHPEEKRAIGREAASMIEEGMAVFLGNGTTTMEIIRHLPSDRHIHIFTNSLNHAAELSKRSNVDVFVVGGFLRDVSFAMVGQLAKRVLDRVHFDLAFLGVNGLSVEYGLTIPSLEESEIAAEIVRRSQRAVIVADHTKFKVVAHGKIADLEEVDTVITDRSPDPGIRKALADLGIKIRLAQSRGR